MDIVTVDFETDAIVHNPAWLPPAPAGVAIHVDGRSSYHVGEDMLPALREVWHRPILCHNASFDISVATHHLGLPWPKEVHDTMYLLYLLDPYAKTYSLKPNAERYLNLPPDEQDVVKEWVLSHIPGATLKNWGAHIAKAPVEIVAPYAIGDVVRTKQLFDTLYDQVCSRGMKNAYDRERALMPILAAGSRTGIDLDRNQLAEDIGLYESALYRATRMMFQLLGTEFNPDSDKEMVRVLEQADAVDVWTYTEKGAKSVARKNLSLKPEFLALKQLMDYRGMLSTCLSTFMHPWMELSSIDGKLHPEWNQTRSDRSGTRTGRLSSSNPNFQNVPNSSDILAPRGLPKLPAMRSYIRPPAGHTWLKRDFSAQEMRIMAHFAEGALYEAYQEDPNVDPHAMVQQMIKELLHLELPRKHVKITGFGIMYGMGIDKLADSLEIERAMAVTTREAYFAALPEVKKLSAAIKNRGSSGDPIKTWGGRLIYREPHPERNLSYKLLNFLIQGSAADQTKQALVDWEQLRHPTDVFMATVHDEINIAVPTEDMAGGMFRLRRAMDADRFDVPFRSEGFAGSTWENIKEYEA